MEVVVQVVVAAVHRDIENAAEHTDRLPMLDMHDDVVGGVVVVVEDKWEAAVVVPTLQYLVSPEQ
jgi:hypothetical protein